MMRQDNLLAQLNEPQHQAVTAANAPTLVLAGAGSGKTRVLVHRIAWLIHTQGLHPTAILAVTFTNKAANEMRGRIEQLLGMPMPGMWIGTFHGLSHRFLRAHWHEAGLAQGFQILDSDDQLRLIRRVLRALEVDESKWPPKKVQWFINACKEAGQRPQAVDNPGDYYTRQQLKFYQAYEEACRVGQVVDFTELLLRTLETLRASPTLLAHYRQRFAHLLVDEFQDTNTLQYQWLRLLAGDPIPVFAVGDDDQSIYGWRGARIEHIQHFSEDFPTAQVIRLEQNYRSTSTILAAANQLIAHNQGRLGKNLWTEGRQGEPILLYQAYNDLEEARFAVQIARQWRDEGGRYSDIAWLYRSNAQSRVLEEHLIQAGIPYRVYGGLRFFERQEIKDALAYLRLLVNRDDDGAFERVINHPPRGIGARSLAAIRDQARARGGSFWEAARAMAGGGDSSGRIAKALQRFVMLIEELANTEYPTLAEQVAAVIKVSGLRDHYAKDTSEREQARVENLDELVNAADYFEDDPEAFGEMPPLMAFLAQAALEAGESGAEKDSDSVQLMTLHAAKGLEFPLVCIVGLEEGLFPHSMAMDNPGGLEEERRLCYVGITRAEQRLVLTYALSRRMYGRDIQNPPSRFLRELPEDALQPLHAEQPRLSQGAKAQRQEPSPSAVDSAADTGTADTGQPFAIGQTVWHSKFGEGVVLGYEGSGPQARVEVQFQNAGRKWLVLAYARLQAMA